VPEGVDLPDLQSGPPWFEVESQISKTGRIELVGDAPIIKPRAPRVPVAVNQQVKLLLDEWIEPPGKSSAKLGAREL